MTVQISSTLQSVLRAANPNTLADVLRKGRADLALSPIKVTLTGLTSATSFDITTAAVRLAATVVGLTPALRADETLPPAAVINTLRVTAGTATGDRAITDSGGTASATVAKISDDGKTVTFEAAVTAFVISYLPRMQFLETAFPQAAP